MARGWIVGWGQVSPSSPGYLTDADLLHWLGVTRSATAATFTVLTAQGSLRTIRLTAAAARRRSLPRLRYVPSPLYLRHAAEPYWLRILARQRAVYLKYNHCLPAPGSGGWPRGRWRCCGRTRRTGWSWTCATTSAVTTGRSSRCSAASGPTRLSTCGAGSSA